jgi:hypothetical protein
MFFDYFSKRNLRKKIDQLLAESDKIVADNKTAHNEMFMTAERLAADGHIATAHQFISTIRGLLTGYKEFSTDTKMGYPTWERAQLKVALTRAEGYLNTLRHAPTKDDFDTDPGDEIILRLGIESKEAEAATRIEELIEFPALHPQSTIALDDALVADYRALLLEHGQLMVHKPLANFLAITNRYEQLESHLKRIQKFRKRLV